MVERTLISFDENTMDEWICFLKQSKVKDDFTAKGIDVAKIVLQYENMPKSML